MPVVARGRIELTVGGPFKGRRRQVLVQAIERGLLESGGVYLRRVRQLTPVFSGQLRSTYQIQFIRRPRRGVKITSPLGYAQNMEFGRRKGARFPPTGPIRNWVSRRVPGLVKKFGLAGATFVMRRHIADTGIIITRKGGIQRRRGPKNKGAMFRRAVDQLGSGFATEIIAKNVKRMEARLR